VQSPFHPSRIDTISTPIIGDGFEFDMLRDDLIHPIVSGNKWRKLKYIIQHILVNKTEHLVTFGGAYSNHLVATAFAGKYFNIKTSAFVRGDEVRPLNHYEQLCIDHNMELIKVNRADYKNKTALYNNYFPNPMNTVFINEGGDHPLALLGCEEILNELDKHYDYILLSMGTGTTMEGLVKAVNNKHLDTKILGISSLKNNFDLDKKMAHYDATSFQIFHDYHRGKYGKFDDVLVKFIKDFYSETGIKTDVVYTGKMLMALNDMIQKDIIHRDQNVLCIHTGGLLAFPD